MSQVRVRTDTVTVARGGRPIVDEVTVAMARGEVVGIVGPNGAGKSTLLRVIAGDISPTTGRVELLGEEAADATLRELARIRAYVGPQAPSNVSFLVREVVAMGRYPYRAEPPDADADRGHIETAMELTDIAHLADRPMRGLSSGEQQRAALARAIVQQTPVLLLDEPTSALDVGHQEMVMDLLQNLADGGVTVIAVLHDLNLAAAHTDQLVLLNQGQVDSVGRPAAVLTDDRLSRTYQQPMRVIDHPFRSCPLVLTTG